MRLYDGEPVAGPWRAVSVARVLDLLGRLVLPAPPAEQAPPASIPRRILAVDGRSGGGKTIVADRLAAAVPGAAVVRTDDVAWYHAFFDWADLLRDGVLEPVRRGAPVDYRPPEWDRRGREGAIVVPGGVPLVIVEGVGAGRGELAEYFDALVWVQADAVEARRRGLERDGPDSADFWAEWQAAEDPFQAAQRPWERADLIVNGTPGVAHDPRTELVMAPPIGAGNSA